MSDIYILALDTTSRHCSISVSKGRRIQVEYNFTTTDQLSASLIPALEFVFKSVGLKPADIDVFGIGTGPGLFTGIRVGLSTLKGLLFGQNKPVVPVPTLEALAYKYVNSNFTVAPLIDARRDEVYLSAYRPENGILNEILEPQLIHITQLEQSISGLEDIHFIGSGVEAHQELLKEKFNSDKLLHRSFYAAPEICKIAAAKFEAGEYITNLQELMPLYIRKPDAVVNLKK